MDSSLPVVNGFSDEFRHVVHEFLSIKGRPYETNVCVLGDGVAKGVVGSVEYSFMLVDVSWGGLVGEFADFKD